MKTKIAALAIILAVPATAHAQAYVQVQGGLDSVSVLDGSSEGVSYGAAVGYSVPLNDAFFAGAEVSFDDSTTKECVSNTLIAGDRTCIRSGRDIAVLARVGSQLGDRSQVYVLGGYANARLNASYNDGVSRESEGTNLDGFRLGTGLQLDFTDNLFSKVEYRYSNYQDGFSRHNGVVALGVKF